HTYQPPQSPAQSATADVNQAPTSRPPVSQLPATAQLATPPQPPVATATPVKAEPVAQQAAAQNKPATDAANQVAAAYAILGLSESPQDPTPAAVSDVDLEQLTALLETDSVESTSSTVTSEPDIPAPVAMPWDQWLEESTLPSAVTESATPAALVGLEAWLAPTTTADQADSSVLSDWDRWLQQQQAPPKRPQSHSNLEDWLAAFNTSDSAEAEAGFFEMPLAAPDTRMPKVVRFQRGPAHSRKDS
ncbi:MAG: hypothetical protein HC926_00225, partial [Synechococcaceae cyanobacterium SM2_3_60]|nr:hypothetical protein [Synechococcaceae cyanobacterium SM2_3_60]